VAFVKPDETKKLEGCLHLLFTHVVPFAVAQKFKREVATSNAQ
jgi:hypothetical protein